MIRGSIEGILALSFFLLTLGTVSAHEGVDDASADHMSHYEISLGPGEQESIRVTWAGQILKARWLFLLSARVTGDAVVRVEMTAPNGNAPLASWDWEADGDVHTQVVELPQDGFYDLSFFSSPGSPETAEITFQFDQSCECTGKKLDLEGGVILFQQEVETGDRIQFSFDRLPGRDFYVWAGVRRRNALS